MACLLYQAVIFAISPCLNIFYVFSFCFVFLLRSHLLFCNERILVFMVFSRPSASCSVWTTVDLLLQTVPVLLVSCFCSLLRAVSSCKHLTSLQRTGCVPHTPTRYFRSSNHARSGHQTCCNVDRVAIRAGMPYFELWNARSVWVLRTVL